MRKIIDDETNRSNINDVLVECCNIVNYINNCLQDKANLFKRKMPKIIIPKEDVITRYTYPLPRINILSNIIEPI